MNDTSRGIGASLLIHGALMGLFVMLNAVWVAERPRVKIDLGILRSAGGPPAPAPAPVKRRPAAQPAVQPAAVSPAAAPSPDVQEYPGPPAPSAEAEVGGSGGDMASSGSAGVGPADEAAQRTAYVNEYFLFIRERIVRSLVFPPAARRMGWSGRVLVSFIVCRDGQVSEIRIVESTGYPVLDRSVVDTIRKVAPFPKAPVEAELTMPIVYRLL